MDGMIPDNWQRALERRRAHFHIVESTTLRLVHDEDDRIRIDRFGHVCWFYCYQAPSPAELDAMEAFALAVNSPHWCAQLMQQRGQDPHSRQQFHSDMPDEWTAEEEGLRYYLRRNQSLSPGLFLDQRANRRWLRDQSTDRSVLNLFSYTGGFSLNAAFGGAHQVVSVDLSRSFLAWSRANFALNKIDAEHHEFWPSDTRYFLRGCARRGRQFDVVVCDPPSFGRSSNGIFRLEKDLSSLLQQIDKVLAQDGLMLLSNNYEGWDQRTFAQRVEDALPKVRYGRVELPASDLDVRSAAAHGLKVIALRKL